jgi:hypothetical protein
MQFHGHIDIGSVLVKKEKKNHSNITKIKKWKTGMTYLGHWKLW